MIFFRGSKKNSSQNVVRIKNFSFKNIPYVVYSNPAPIEPFILLASNYGNSYFRKHDIIPLLSYADGLLLDTSFYTSNNIDFEFIQKSGSVICQVPRNAINMMSALTHGLKIHVTKDLTYFILPGTMFTLFNKYPQHSPFVRIEENEFIVLNHAIEV